jgi:SAM-dependent MidA family methyltransferase
VKNANHTFSAIAQGEFLIRLGIETRVMNLLQKMKDEEKAAQLVSAFERYVVSDSNVLLVRFVLTIRLVSPEQMGTIYKVAAFSSKNVSEVAGFIE